MSPIVGHDRRTAAEPDRGGHAAVRRSRSTAARSRPCRSRAPTGRARAAPRPSRPRSRPRSNTAIGAGNATATVTTNTDGSLSVGIAPTGDPRAPGAGVGREHRARDVARLDTRSAPTASAAGRSSPAPNASNFAVSALVAGNPAAVAAGVAGNGPLDGSIALQLGDMATSNTGADATYNTLIQQLGVDAKDVQTRDNVQQQSVQSLDACPELSSGGQHRRRDDEHGRVPEGVRSLGQVHHDAQLDARDAHDDGRT